jgi:hypothetical protein
MDPRRWIARIEAALAAVAFAEEGESETAKRILAEAAEAGPQEEREPKVDPRHRAPLAKQA